MQELNFERYNYDQAINAALLKINNYLDQIDPAGVDLPRYNRDGLTLFVSTCEDGTSILKFESRLDLLNYLGTKWAIMNEAPKSFKFYDLTLSVDDVTSIDHFVNATNWNNIEKTEVSDLGDLVLKTKINGISVYHSMQFNEYVFSHN